MSGSKLPPLPYATWVETKTTLHLCAQIVGKIRLTLHPEFNHWWHVPLYVSTRGLSTRVIPHGAINLTLEFDLIDHQLVISTSQGDRHEIKLGHYTVSEFYAKVMQALSESGIEVKILAHPFDSSKVGSTTPFAKDNEHKTYDPKPAHDFWRILVDVDSVMKEFRGRFIGKCSPVHFFWHSFDLACTRFSGRTAPVAEGADIVTQKAYSHEVISAGFWPGDDNTPDPAFYTYAAPEPAGLAKSPLSPPAAFWFENNGSAMAILPYEEYRKASDPRQTLLGFLQSAYDAAAKLAEWPPELV